jgi:hypothetical protein
MSDYFGYETYQNEDLMENRRMARRMGEDITHYPPPSGDETYIEPTPNFDEQFGEGLSPGEETRAYYANGIEQIYKRIMSQDPVVLHQLADQWFELNQVLDDLRTRVLKAATNLKEGGDGAGGNGGWAGAGADAFLARGPGATLKSIDDWEQASFQNWMGTLALGGVISQRRGEMAALWSQYKEAMVTQSNMWLDNGMNYDMDGERYSSADAIPKGSYAAEEYVTWMRQAQLAWHHKAQKIQYDMAQDYWNTMSEDYAGGRATVYEGPTDSVMPNMEFIARSKMPAMPSIPNPNITTPNGVNPNITAPNIAKPDVNVQSLEHNTTKPEITPPSVDNIPKPDIDAPTVTPPNITTPVVTPPAVTPPAVPPPVLPQNLPGGGPGRLPAVRPGLLPGAGDLLGNLKSNTGPGVLRAGMTPPGGEGLPPGLPQGGRTGQAPPPPQIKGRGPSQGTPMVPQGKGGSPERSAPETPGTPATPSATDQFGGLPSTPASPVLRNPHASPPQATRGGGPRRGTPGLSGPAQRNADGSTPLRPDAAPPVLGRPAPRAPERTNPARPSVTSTPPGALPNPLAPPPRPTASPVVGRAAQPAPGAPRPPEPTAGVMRGKRNDGNSGYEGEIGSRKREAKDPQLTIDEEFDRISAILAQEKAWTVETPGGGVLDGAPLRSQTPSAEPKPTLGA